MERNVAERLMKLFLELGGPLNEAAELTYEIADESERRAIRRGMGEIIIKIYEDLQRPIIRQYPDLDPDKETGG